MALYDVLGNLIAGGTLFADAPVGVINPFGGANAPEGWLLCNGQAISRTDYADLFAAIGTAYGSGDGSTTFNVPDMRGKVPVGFNSSETEFDNLGETGGEKTHTLTVTEIPSHNHATQNGGNSYSVNDVAYGQSLFNCTPGSITVYSSKLSGLETGYKGSSGAHNNLQPYNTVNFIIKAKHVSLPADFLAEIQDLLDSKNILTYGSD